MIAFRSLTAKLLVVFVPLVSLSVLCLFAALEYRDYSTRLDAKERQLHRLAKVAVGALAQPVWEYDVTRIEEILGDLQRDPNFIMAVVLDQDGELLASVGELQDPRLEARLTAESAVVYEGGTEDEAFGRVRVAFHRDELIRHLEERLVADSEALHSLLGRLREMLEGYDPEAADVLDEIRGYGIPGASETMGVLGHCVADYDFEAALEQMVCLEKAVAHAGYEESR